nr:MAG TPA: Protein of unknown function (DUF3553) [Caudoviricetes sp.]
MEIGDKVYAQDWFEGIITDIDGNEALIEFETARGGGSIWFSMNDLQLVEGVK